MSYEAFLADCRKHCRCCPCCCDYPCAGTCAGGMCDMARCSCDDEPEDDDRWGDSYEDHE